MSVIKKGEEHYRTLNDVCAECRKELGDIVVCYDFDLREGARSVLLHPECAVTVGNRLIADGYSNRNKG